MGRITPQPGIMEIALYQGGAAHVPGVERVIKLSSNENPYGPSPQAIAAAAKAAAQMHLYPSTDHADLRRSIGELNGLDADRIICGVGSDEVLQFVTQAFAGPGDEIIMTEHGFSMYPILTRMAGATPVQVAERDRVVDVDAILNGVTEKTRLVLLTNPGNPTGTRLDDSELNRLAEQLPAEVILVIDAAYAEFADGYDGGASLARERDNVLMTRTFSKIFGLGGLRVGWGFGPRWMIDVLNRMRQPFNLSVIQIAAAQAALEDRAHVAFTHRENARLRDWLIGELAGAGIQCDASCTNFILARFADQNEAMAADSALKSCGLIVRGVAGYGLPGALRITIGDEAACRAVAQTLGEFRARGAA